MTQRRKRLGVTVRRIRSQAAICTVREVARAAILERRGRRLLTAIAPLQPVPFGEDPQGGIWFWSLFRLGIVVMRLTPRRAEA